MELGLPERIGNGPRATSSALSHVPEWDRCNIAVRCAVATAAAAPFNYPSPSSPSFRADFEVGVSLMSRERMAKAVLTLKRWTISCHLVDMGCTEARLSEKGSRVS